MLRTKFAAPEPSSPLVATIAARGARTWLLLVLFGMLSLRWVSPATAQVGPLLILPHVHAYNDGSSLQMPVKGIVDWIGGAVSYSGGTVTVAWSGSTVIARVGSRKCLVNGNEVDMGSPAREYGRIACMPARFLARTLGIGIEYVGWVPSTKVVVVDEDYVPDEYEYLGCKPCVRLTANGETARVLVHQAPPNVVCKVIADLEHSVQFDAGDGHPAFTLGKYADDWIITVGKIRSGYFYSAEPSELDDSIYPGHTVYFSNAWAVYGYRGGTWKMLLSGTDDPTYSDWAKAGIPVELAGALGGLRLYR